jgi:DNA-binding transcriptional regulator YdaS (Cro superfamily)
MKTTTENSQDVIEALGGPAEVGRLLGISSQAVSQWGEVPAAHVLAVVLAAREKGLPSLLPEHINSARDWAALRRIPEA